MNKFKQWWYETDSIEMVLFATIWSLFGYGAYVVILELWEKFVQADPLIDPRESTVSSHQQLKGDC